MLSFGSIINIRQLLILGMKEEHLYICAVILGLAAAYFLLQPIVMWFIQIGAQGALTYMITSLLLMVVLLSIKGFFELSLPTDIENGLMKHTLQGLAGFGLFIMVINIWGRIRSKQKRAVKALFFVLSIYKFQRLVDLTGGHCILPRDEGV
ncbi:hypothetical protein JNUCC1_00092 [Lentibacillus sp. JNUCC-1]|nr:hypothetical protein [Lentibacillus sp. JNUCC-1]